MDSLLLAAVTWALACWSGRDSVLVDVEGHGREDLFDEVDLSRTVGWFTTIYPVRFTLPGPGADPDWPAVVRAARAALRAVPGRGIGYGALRYLSPPDRVAGLAAAAPAEVTFNYLGHWDNSVGGATIYAGERPGSEARDPADRRRRHLLDVVAEVCGGELSVSWTYSTNVHTAGRATELADRCVAALRQLAATA